MRSLAFSRTRLAGLLALSVCGLGATAEGAMADYRSMVMADQPSSYFRMDDASDSTVMANEVAGAPNGNTVQSAPDSPNRGVAGALTDETPNRAFLYHGSPDSDGSSFPVTSYDAFSLEFFVWTGQEAPAGATQWHEGIGLVDGEIAGYTTDTGVAMVSGGVVGFGMGSAGGDTTIHSQTPINDGQWHHVVATHDGNGIMELYVDGVLEDEELDGPSIPRTNTYFGVGYTATNYLDQHAAAIIDEVAFYRYSLSPGRIAAHAGLGPNTLDVYPGGGGRGDITGPGIDCIDIGVFQGGAGDCSEEYAPGTQVTLTPRPHDGSRFGSFFNPFADIPGHADICDGTRNCSFTAQAGAEDIISATFHLKPKPLGREMYGSGSCQAECTTIGETSATLKEGLLGSVNPVSLDGISLEPIDASMFGGEQGDAGGVLAVKVQDTQTRFVGRNGSTLVNQHGTPKLLPSAAGVAKTGGKLVGSDGATLIGSDGATLIGSDGATIVSEQGAGKAATGPGEARKRQQEATYKTYVLGRYTAEVVDNGDVGVQFEFTDEGGQLVQSFGEMNYELKDRGLSPRSLPVMVAEAVQPADEKGTGGAYAQLKIK